MTVNENRKLLFVVNPKAGKKKHKDLVGLIQQQIQSVLSYDIRLWDKIEAFPEIIVQMLSGGYTDVVAVGGDGTVNQIAAALRGKNIALGILPAGSGNGLARSLGLSMDPVQALQQIVDGRTEIVDSGLVNGIPFFCTAGIGFDAHIGTLFASSTKRGLQSYVKITFKELFNYKSASYTLRLNDQQIETKAFLITVANAGQYGNDFYIAPQATLQDGLFHVVVVRPLGVLKSIGLFIKILRGQAHKHSRVDTYTTTEVTIVRPAPGAFHFDGEPANGPAEIPFTLKTSSLKAIVGAKFKKS